MSVSSIVLLSHAFVPIEHFIHRGDDAFYYFKVAVNYPEMGFWTFDRIHPTNGVQPLWALMLTAVAQVLAWFSVRDADILARVFVALTAALHSASSLLLFHLLSKKVSVGTGVAAAGGLLFPLGITWARVWGMENSLYALLLVSTISYFHLIFAQRATAGTAVLLGLLLGLTGLARLNAGIFIPCLLLYLLWRGPGERFAVRLSLAIIAGATASVLVTVYLAANYYTTGQVLPVSGAVKTISTELFLQSHGIESRTSGAFLKLLYRQLWDPARWFIGSRAGDGLWIVGGRMFFSGGIGMGALAAIISAFLLLPCAIDRRQWFGLLRARFGRLSQFSYVLAFGVLNAAVSALLYPAQARYAMTRWWLVENEIILVVIVSTLVVAAVGYFAGSLVDKRLHVPLATAALVFLAAFHSQQTVRHYWRGEVEFHDWNLSWNDESYKAAQWLAKHVPADALVGSWNAGVLGFYATQRVVNLDGLINNHDLLPYLRQEAVSRYIAEEEIVYLSDMESMFSVAKIEGNLKLQEVYSSFSPLMKRHYRIYRVEHQGQGARTYTRDSTRDALVGRSHAER